MIGYDKEISDKISGLLAEKYPDDWCYYVDWQLIYDNINGYLKESNLMIVPKDFVTNAASFRYYHEANPWAHNISRQARDILGIMK